MRIIHIIFFVFLMVSVLIVNYDLSNRDKIVHTNMNSAIEKNITSFSRNDSGDKVGSRIQNNAVSAFLSFNVRFKKEAAELAKIQNDPERVQKRLQTLATSMTQQNVTELYELISDDKNDGEQRALAVELLSIKNDTASLMALQNFVGNSKTVNGNKWDRKKEFETVLRAQAVESIAAYPQKDIALSTLNFLQHKVDNKFLADRIGRATLNLNNKTTDLQQQDDGSLKNLIE